MTDIILGETVLTCAETGERFTAQRQGISTNYATDRQGNVYSDEGVNIRERRELLDRSGPFTCYVSGNGRHVTGWKGNVLGYIVRTRTGRLARWSCFHGGTINYYRVRDVHGGMWYGRGSPGVGITLRPLKPKSRKGCKVCMGTGESFPGVTCKACNGRGVVEVYS